MEKRTWTQEEKLQIIAEAKINGVKATLDKHGIYPATFYSWKRKFIVDGEDGLADDAKRRKTRRRIQELEQKVTLLKQLLAEKEMELALRDELLKKNSPQLKKKALVRRYMNLGLQRDKCLAICQISRHTFYYQPKSKKPGK